MERHFTEAQRNEIIRLYRSGKGTKELSAIFNKSQRSIWYTLRRGGVELENRSILSCNDHFFDNVNTEVKAYWLGFLMADGYIAGKPFPRVCIGLASKDRQHLEEFRLALQSKSSITSSTSYMGSKEYSQVTIQIRSDRLAESLALYGVTPRKTHTARWPTKLPDEMGRHFLRGFFDGDGWWYKHPINPQYVDFWLSCANRDFLQDCKEFMQSQCRVGNPNIHRKAGKLGTAFTLSFRGPKQCANIFSLVYRDATVYLQRKHAKVAHCFQY